MRRYRVNYWVTLFFNGVVVGIWPAAAVAAALAAFLHNLSSFIAFFLVCMVLFVPGIMWLYHAAIWPRRKRRRRFR
jgi:hypothetical protein